MTVAIGGFLPLLGFGSSYSSKWVASLTSLSSSSSGVRIRSSDKASGGGPGGGGGA